MSLSTVNIRVPTGNPKWNTLIVPWWKSSEMSQIRARDAPAESFFYKLRSRRVILMHLRLSNPTFLRLFFDILLTIYARSTTFSMRFLLDKMKFPKFSLIFKHNFQIPWFFPFCEFFKVIFLVIPCLWAVGTLKHISYS